MWVTVWECENCGNREGDVSAVAGAGFYEVANGRVCRRCFHEENVIDRKETCQTGDHNTCT